MSNKKKYAGFSSVAIHAGHSNDPKHAHLTPIYASSTYTFDSAEQGMNRFNGTEPGYIYGRWGNPTITEAEEKISALESFGLVNEDGSNVQLKTILHSSGMAALSTLLLANLKAGDKILTHYSLYGGTQELVEKILPPLGIEAIIVDLKKISNADEAINSDASIKMLYLETPANPTIQCVDLAELTAIGKRNKLIVAVDNTFATPYLQQPFLFGVDYVFHSTTKFLNGHGTAIGGALVGKDVEKMNTHVTKVHRLLGANSNAFDAYLLIQGIKTLEVRMERHKLVEHIIIESEKFEGSFTELVNNLNKQSVQWKEWIDGCTEAQLQHVFAFIRQKEQFKLPTYQMLLHIFNHATYHRGQLVTMLRNLGVQKIPSTDFSTFCMLK